MTGVKRCSQSGDEVWVKMEFMHTGAQIRSQNHMYDPKILDVLIERLHMGTGEASANSQKDAKY